MNEPRYNPQMEMSDCPLALWQIQSVAEACERWLAKRGIKPVGFREIIAANARRYSTKTTEENL